MGEYSDMDARIRASQVARMRAQADEMDRIAHDHRIRAEACGEEARRWRLIAQAAERDLVERLDAEAVAAQAAAGTRRLLDEIRAAEAAALAEGDVGLADEELDEFHGIVYSGDAQWPEPDGDDR